MNTQRNGWCQLPLTVIAMWLLPLLLASAQNELTNVLESNGVAVGTQPIRSLPKSNKEQSRSQFENDENDTVVSGIVFLPTVLGSDRSELTSMQISADQDPVPEGESDQTGIVRVVDGQRYEIALLSTPLELIEVDIRDFSRVQPTDRSFELHSGVYGSYYPRPYMPLGVYWCGADIRYQPLYFEDVVLERYGQTRHDLIQPYFSAARFFISTGLLPLNMLSEHPYDCDFPLGYCLPGNCTPPMYQRLWIK